MTEIWEVLSNVCVLVCVCVCSIRYSHKRPGKCGNVRALVVLVVVVVVVALKWHSMLRYV